MNEITTITNHLEREGNNSPEIIQSTLEEMIREKIISPENSFNKKRLKHFDDFLDDCLSKYGLIHGYQFESDGSYREHEIFVGGTLSIEKIPSWILDRKRIMNTDLGKLLEINPTQEEFGDNIQIDDKEIKVKWIYAKPIAKFYQRKFNPSDVYTKVSIKTATDITCGSNEYKPIIKKIKRLIEEYCKLIREGYEISPQEKRPLIRGVIL